MRRGLGAQSAPAAARRLLGPLARVKPVDGSARLQGFTSLQTEFFAAELPLWLPRRWRDHLQARAERRWGTLNFVQKRFSVEQEAAVLRCLYLAAPRAPGPARLPVPLVLGVRSGDGCGQVLLEDLPGVGGQGLTTPAEADALAEQIVRLEDHLAQAEDRTGIPLQRHRVLANPRRLRGLIRRAEDPTLDGSTLMERVRRLARNLETAPSRLSHNDIGPGNMAVGRDPGRGLTIRFIDFGSVTHNVLGADLHHYAAWGLDSAEQAAFFDRLSSRYAELVHQPLPLVRAGAYAYALERSVMRWWRRQERRRLPGRARSFLTRIALLLRLAEAEIAQVPLGR